MDGLSGVASVIAVIEISAKITSLCFQYSIAVKDAKKDIERLQKKVADLNDVLGGLKQLFDGRDKTRLSAASKLAGSLKDCLLRLEELKTQLDLGKTRKTLRRFGVRALKWPFTSKEMEKIVVDLERYEQTFSLALQVDQTGLMLDVDQKIDLAKLPIAKGASFDSHMEEHNARCLENTRVEQRRHIAEWAKDRHGKSIFWLNGMAGTGKSTIARTVAQSLADQGQLGASFFFKKGEGDRGNASRFFTTLAADLTVQIPGLIPGIRKAIGADPAISERALKVQFEKLILQPLSETRQASPQASDDFIIVIDALDECEREDDIRVILHLLAQTKTILPVSLRVFLTSRPELPVRLGFKQMSDGTHQDLILHEIPKQTIEQDIALFLEHELGEIREQRSLPPYWPSKDQIHSLVEIAIPLFIFAATACRYIGDERDNPKKRLDIILQYQMAPQVSKLDRTYLPILNQLFDEEDGVDRERRVSEFREIVGSVVILESPLSIVSLAHLLGIPKEDITCRLDLLHSVLSIPVDEDTPVRLLHLSFRDFLLDPQKRGKSPFWLDERETHERLTDKCLQLMSSSNGLRENMCNLSKPGTIISEIDQGTIDRCLQPVARYACRYWVHHLKHSQGVICDDDLVHVFLQKHFLYWLEAMSLIREVSESIHMIISLQLLVDSNKGTKILDFLQDAKRFVLRYRSILDEAPLQLYSSALIFAPESSIIRKSFSGLIPRWMTRLSKVECDWNAALQTLEGHSLEVNAVDFSPDGQLVASGSDDSTVRLWNSATGSCRSILEGHSGWVNAIAFSPDGQLIASGSSDSTVRLWDAATGSCRSILEGHSDWVRAIAFSPDSQLIASSSDDDTVRLWDAATEFCRNTLEGHSHSELVLAVAFSPDSQLIASSSDYYTVRLWDAATGFCRSMLEGHSELVTAVAFSPDSQLIASSSNDYTVRLWNVATGSCYNTLKGHLDCVNAVAFSPDSQLVASGSSDSTVRLWDAVTGVCRSTLEGHSDWVKALVFSPDSQLLASGSRDSTVQLWDAATWSSSRTIDSHSNRVTAIVLSPDGQLVASGSGDSTVRLWSAGSASCLSTFEGQSGWIKILAFSPDSKLLASASNNRTTWLWDVATESQRCTLVDDLHEVMAVVFSPDSQLVASGSRDSEVRLWDAATGFCLSTLKGHLDCVNAVAFSADGQLLASGSADSTVRIWDAATGLCRSSLEGHSKGINAIAFSPDGQLLASGSCDSTVRLWNVATGSCRSMLEGHSSSVSAVAFMPNSKQGWSGSLDFKIRLWGVSPPNFDTFSYQKQELSNIFVQDQWVRFAEKRLLRLPNEYQPSCIAGTGNSIWLGHVSGRITCLEFNLEEV